MRREGFVTCTDVRVREFISRGYIDPVKGSRRDEEVVITSADK